jgi:hypothetical protein
MQVDDAPGCRPLRRSVMVLGLVCLLAFGAGAQTPSSPYRLRTEKCPTLQDVFESMQADAAEQERKGGPKGGMPPPDISRGILERLETVDLDTLQSFFECFRFRESQVSEADRRQGVVRSLSALIVVGYVDVPWSKDIPGSTVKRPQYALVACEQKADGTRSCHGTYNVDG